MPLGRPVEARSSFFISPYDLCLALTGEAFSLLRTLRHAPAALDLIKAAYDHGGHNEEANGDRGGQPVAAMIEPVSVTATLLCVPLTRFDSTDGEGRQEAVAL
jgi:hypothetical protein